MKKYINVVILTTLFKCLKKLHAEFKHFEFSRNNEYFLISFKRENLVDPIKNEDWEPLSTTYSDLSIN